MSPSPAPHDPSPTSTTSPLSSLPSTPSAPSRFCTPSPSPTDTMAAPQPHTGPRFATIAEEMAYAATLPPVIHQLPCRVPDLAVERKGHREAREHQERLARKYPVLKGTPTWILENIESLQLQYAEQGNDNDIQIADECWPYLYKSKFGPWLIVTRVAHPRRKKGKAKGIEQYITIPLTPNAPYGVWKPMDENGVPEADLRTPIPVSVKSKGIFTNSYPTGDAGKGGKGGNDDGDDDDDNDDDEDDTLAKDRKLAKALAKTFGCGGTDKNTRSRSGGKASEAWKQDFGTFSSRGSEERAAAEKAAQGKAWMEDFGAMKLEKGVAKQTVTETVAQNTVGKDKGCNVEMIDADDTHEDDPAQLAKWAGFVKKVGGKANTQIDSEVEERIQGKQAKEKMVEKQRTWSDGEKGGLEKVKFLQHPSGIVTNDENNEEDEEEDDEPQILLRRKTDPPFKPRTQPKSKEVVEEAKQKIGCPGLHLPSAYEYFYSDLPFKPCTQPKSKEAVKEAKQKIGYQGLHLPSAYEYFYLDPPLSNKPFQPETEDPESIAAAEFLKEIRGKMDEVPFPRSAARDEISSRPRSRDLNVHDGIRGMNSSVVASSVVGYLPTSFVAKGQEQLTSTLKKEEGSSFAAHPSKSFAIGQEQTSTPNFHVDMSFADHTPKSFFDPPSPATNGPELDKFSPLPSRVQEFISNTPQVSPNKTRKLAKLKPNSGRVASSQKSVAGAFKFAMEGLGQSKKELGTSLPSMQGQPKPTLTSSMNIEDRPAGVNVYNVDDDDVAAAYILLQLAGNSPSMTQTPTSSPDTIAQSPAKNSTSFASKSGKKLRSHVKSECIHCGHISSIKWRMGSKGGRHLCENRQCRRSRDR